MITRRLSSILRGRTANPMPDTTRLDSRQIQQDCEETLLEADQENEHMRAEISTLESQVSILQGALAVLAGAKDRLR